MSKWLIAMLLSVIGAFPVFAVELPATVQIRNALNLQTQLEHIEDAVIEAGAPKKAVYGATSKLANFIEDSVLSTGQALTLHPQGIADILTTLAKDGEDRAAIGNKLVQMQKASKL